MDALYFVLLQILWEGWSTVLIYILYNLWMHFITLFCRYTGRVEYCTTVLIYILYNLWMHFISFFCRYFGRVEYCTDLLYSIIYGCTLFVSSADILGRVEYCTDLYTLQSMNALYYLILQIYWKGLSTVLIYILYNLWMHLITSFADIKERVGYCTDLYTLWSMDALYYFLLQI